MSDKCPWLISEAVPIAGSYDKVYGRNTVDFNNGHFLFDLGVDEFDEFRAEGMGRNYSAKLKFVMPFGGKFDKKTLRALTDEAEQFKRMIHNYRDFIVRTEWIDESGTWGSTTHTWSEDLSRQCWQSAYVNIDYTQDEDLLAEGKAQFEIDFNCFRESIYG